MSELGAVYILWLRQLKRYSRSRSRIIGGLGQPLLFMVALGFGFGPIVARAGGGDYLSFLVPGIISMTILFTSIFSGIEIIWDKQFGFLKETLVAPVSRTSIMIGRTLGGATISVMQGMLILLIAMLIGFRPSIVSLPLALLAMALISLLFTAFGTAIASVMEDMHGFQLIMNFIVMPLFFFSGAIFPLADQTKALAIAASVNPLSYGVDLLRYSLMGMGYFALSLDVAVLLCVALLCFAVGSWLFTRIEV